MGDDGSNSISRRRFVAGAGAAGVAAIAGCTANPNLSGTVNSASGDITGCTPGKTLSGRVSITGSSTVYPLAEAVAIAFGRKYPNIDVSLSKTGTGGGFSNFFCQGRSDFNNASRQITKGEKKLCATNNVEPVELHIAKDALTVIVNKDADWVDCMTVDELRQIWKPDGAEKWSDVRPEWPDKKFDLFGAADTSGTFDYFTEVIIGKSGKQRDDYQATEKDNIIVQGVAGNKYAMGYLGYAYYAESKEKVKAVAIDNGDGKCVKPSIQTAKTGKYKPLTRPLFTYVAKDSLAERQVAAFARYFLKQSTNEELVVDDVGYVPNTKKEMKQELETLNEIISNVNDKK
jgi:phosphate transport system substrate-binding protein